MSDITSKGSRQPRWLLAPYIAMVILALYVGLSHFLTSTQYGRDGSLWYLTGVPRVVFPPDELSVRLFEPRKELRLLFGEALREMPIMISEGQAVHRMQWDQTNPRLLVVQLLTDDSSESDLDATKQGSDSKREYYARARTVHVVTRWILGSKSTSQGELSSVTVDGISVEPIHFLERYVDEDRSNLHVYFPLGVNNLSAELSKSLGPTLMWIVLYVLIILLLMQVLALVATFFLGVGSKSKLVELQKSKGVVFIELLSDTAAIPLGLFGTVLGIWMALEGSAEAFASFEDTLAILRNAVLTTVLGMAVKMTLVLRQSLGANLGSSRG